MYKYKLTYLSILLIASLFFSCNKDEQSCQDGVFSPGEEEQTDCGGVCPPCEDGNEEPNLIEIVAATIHGIPMSFSDYDLTKNQDWILNLRNDSIDVYLNFGAGDSLGVRDLKAANTAATYNGVGHVIVPGGTVLFTDINSNDNRLTGFTECNFVSSAGDTLKLKNGSFENIPW